MGPVIFLQLNQRRWSQIPEGVDGREQEAILGVAVDPPVRADRQHAVSHCASLANEPDALSAKIEDFW